MIAGFAMHCQLNAALSSGSDFDVWQLLSSGSGKHDNDLHKYMCAELGEHSLFCKRCDTVFILSLQQGNTSIPRLLWECALYSSDEICDAGYPYSHTRSTSLKRAVESGSLDDVRQLLSQGPADDVNAHPKCCLKHPSMFQGICADCDTPLMAAVRREDIAMMRLLIEHGANVSDKILGIYDHFAGLTCKTAFLVALDTGNEEVIKELVTSGADVNQSFGPVGTALHWCFEHNPTVQILAQSGADPHLTDDFDRTPVFLVLDRCHLRDDSNCSSARESLQALLPSTRDLDTIVQKKRSLGSWCAPIDNKWVTLFLQHGARMRYCQMYLTGSPAWASDLRNNSKLHSERFIELLRAADTDFSGVRQRIASADKDEWETLNLDVLDQKLSQPLTLQTSCVISIRRRLLSIGDVGVWARIDKLPLPPIIRDRVKLEVW